jgi:hypothetical protein
MEATKVTMIAKRVEGIAIGFIGVCFFSMGTTYFQERFIYRMPRILVPVYDLLGSTALAVAMLLLGIALIIWGFSIWKSAAGKSALYVALAIIGLAAGAFLANYNFKSSEDIMQEIDDSRQKQIEEVKQTARPNSKNPEIDRYFDEFDALYVRLEKNEVVADSVQQINDEFMHWMEKAGDLIRPLNGDQIYKFSQYNAKLCIQWNDKMQSIRDE